MQLIYNVILISSIHQSDSVYIYIYIFIFLYKILIIVPYVKVDPYCLPVLYIVVLYIFIPDSGI